MKYSGLFLLVVFFPLWLQGQNNDSPIQPYQENHFYWQYKEEPIMLLGVSKDDNLFQIPDLKQHLDQMVEIGANYIRNTMSERTINTYEVSAYKKTGLKYDLTQWNPKYWQRFDSLLKWTYERDIIVQIEIWATHDFFKQATWKKSPWNPNQNINYSFENTTLQTNVAERANAYHSFFNSVPHANKDTVLLKYQQRFVDKILNHSLHYPNVLYCITNEIQAAQTKYWGWYWSNYIHQKAKSKNSPLQVTEMYWPPDLKAPLHELSFNDSAGYTFFESAQNSAISGQKNWDNLQYIRNKLKNYPRPINAVKIYGKTGNVTWPGTDEEAIDRFWRNILGGCASSRFHRNEQGKYGLGWEKKSINAIKAMRLFLNTVTPWKSAPGNDLLLNRENNQVYLMAEPDNAYGLFFTAPGKVSLNLNDDANEFRVEVISIDKGKIIDKYKIKGGKIIQIATPGQNAKYALTLKKIKK